MIEVGEYNIYLTLIPSYPSIGLSLKGVRVGLLLSFVLFCIASHGVHVSTPGYPTFRLSFFNGNINDFNYKSKGGLS